LKKNILAIAEMEGLAALQNPYTPGITPCSPLEASSRFSCWPWQP
jgi:hypothetical protein